MSKWPAHCRKCQYRITVNGDWHVCDYASKTGKSLVKEYGLQGEPGALQKKCTHWKDGGKVVRNGL